jgi:hypothetical protein
LILSREKFSIEGKPKTIRARDAAGLDLQSVQAIVSRTGDLYPLRFYARVTYCKTNDIKLATAMPVTSEDA